ncbi:MAG: Clp protease N-terminal domain-containing protein, partial [Jatrophihabitantaceae bacterium]
CSTALPRRRCDSPLAGNQLGIIPRVKRVLDRATRDARPRLLSPAHLLLTLVTADEIAREILDAQDADREAIAAAARQAISASETPRRRAG